MANREQALLTFKATLKFRQRFPVAHSPRGMIAKPAFMFFSLATIEHLLDCTAHSPSQIAVKLSTPVHWVCNGKKGRDAEDAFRLAASGRVGTAMVSLPNLVGSTKQVAWAEKIRSKHAMTNPCSVYLKSCQAASWWIANRDVV